MASIPLIAVTACQYDGRRYAPGQSFPVRSQNDAKALTLLGKAKAATVPVPAPTHDTEADEPPPRRTYRRRSAPVEDLPA